MVDLADYQQTAGDWRRAIRDNTHRTRIVIFLFFLMYSLVGFCVDVYSNMQLYNLSVAEVGEAFMHGMIVPYATLLMFGVAGIALFIAFSFHNKLMLLGTDSHEITPESAADLQERQLYNVVEEMKIAAGLQFMPRVFIIEADYMNAFASGFSEKSAMVAITRGLLNKLNREEIKAVMAHELSHIRHLDIKLTLTVALLTNIMLIVIDTLFRVVIYTPRSRDKEDSKGGNGLLIIILVLRAVLPILTILLTLYLSRTRELMADAGSVELMRDNGPMASALIKIQQDHEDNQVQYRQAYGDTTHEDLRRAAYLFDPVEAGLEPVQSLSSFFSTHPSLAERLKSIGFIKK